MSEVYDTNFSLPSVDDDPDTEVGILLMGLGPERLLAGLGVASRELVPTAGSTADPATVTLLVDQARHGMADFAGLVAAGARRWRHAREGFRAANLVPDLRSASLRQVWASASAALASGAEVAPQLRTDSAAERVYLIACWLRPEEITTIAEEHVVLPELPS
jgi:hypothetical protein